MQLEYCKEFIELAQSLSYTEAASLLNITQSTLSKHILALEKEFGAKLFERNRKEVKLTEAGRVFFEYASLSLSQYEDMRDRLADMERNRPINVLGHMKDTEISSVCATAVMLARNRFNLVCTLNPDHDEYDHLGEGDVFMGFANPDQIERLSLGSRELFSSPLCVVTAVEHPLAKKPRVQWSDLEEHTFIRFVSDVTDPAWHQVENACIKSGFKPKTRSISSNNEVEFFSTPLQTSILVWKRTDTQIDLMLETGMRACVPIDEPTARLTTYLVYRPEDEEDLAPFFEAAKEAATLRADTIATTLG